MKRVSNITIILTQCINFAAIFKQNVSKSKRAHKGHRTDFTSLTTNMMHVVWVWW